MHTLTVGYGRMDAVGNSEGTSETGPAERECFHADPDYPWDAYINSCCFSIGVPVTFVSIAP
jgi:hypothetical protein